MTTIRRVPVDFDWPLNKVWDGYLTPERLREDPCPDCVNGWTNAAEWLQTYCHRLTMLADDTVSAERGRGLHPWLNSDPYPPTDRRGNGQPLRPGPDIVDLVKGLGARESFMGFSGDHSVFNTIVRAAGLDPDTWGLCATCDGHGTVEKYPGQRADADAWEPTEPPIGDGWQAWEDVSEGSPISPVFPDRDGLVWWFTTPASIWGARQQPLTREQAEALVGAGSSVGSFVVHRDPSGRTTMIDGDAAVHALGKDT
jgi:hypothetical protein